MQSIFVILCFHVMCAKPCLFFNCMNEFESKNPFLSENPLYFQSMQKQQIDLPLFIIFENFESPSNESEKHLTEKFHFRNLVGGFVNKKFFWSTLSKILDWIICHIPQVYVITGKLSDFFLQQWWPALVWILKLVYSPPHNG